MEIHGKMESFLAFSLQKDTRSSTNQQMQTTCISLSNLRAIELQHHIAGKVSYDFVIDRGLLGTEKAGNPS